MRKIFALLLTIVMMMSLFTGCGSSSQEDEYKVIRFGHAYDASTLDPQNCYDDGSYYVLNNICEGLVVGYDGEIHPGIAESWEISDDSRVFTFHLRESTWSDGTPLTAHDFVYSVKRILDPESAFENAYSFYDLVNGEKYNMGECDFEEVGVKALDDYTVEYTLETPSASGLFGFCSYLYAPVHQATVEEFGETYGAEADKILTNGPFTCTEWLHESKITIKKNENYWNAENVNIDEVQFVVGAADQVAVDLFAANELDAGIFYDQDAINSLDSMGLESESRIAGYNFIYLNCAGGSDETAKFMSNVNFRKALNCAISREDVMKAGAAVGQAADRISAPNLVTDSGKTWDEAYPVEKWSTTAEPEKAKEYLDAALAEIGATVEDVPTLNMLCFDSQANMDKLQAVQDMIYQTLGIECKINPQPIQQMLDMVDNGEFDFWTGGKTLEYPDWYQQVAFEFTNEPGSVSRYDNPEYTKLFDDYDRTTTIEEGEKLLHEMEKTIIEDMTCIHLYWNEDYTYTVSGLTGIKNLNGYGPWFAMCDYTK